MSKLALAAPFVLIVALAALVATPTTTQPTTQPTTDAAAATQPVSADAKRQELADKMRRLLREIKQGTNKELNKMIRELVEKERRRVNREFEPTMKELTESTKRLNEEPAKLEKPVDEAVADLEKTLAEYMERVEKFREMFKEGEPAFTAEQAKKYVAELTPLVEKAAGKKFTRAPKVVLAGRDEVAKSLVADLTMQYERLLPNLTAKQRRKQAQREAKMFVMALLGKYGLLDKTLYLLPKNFPPLLRLIKVDKKHTEAIVKLAIAHELTHALQDQTVDLAKGFGRCRSLDPTNAFEAAMEGHAMLVQGMVGEALKLDKEAREAAAKAASKRLDSDDPMANLMGEIIAQRYEFVYSQGRKFMAHHYRAGGAKKLWRILAAPPATSAMIAAPETYSPVRTKTIDYAAVLNGLEKDFGKANWRVQNIQMGHMLLNATYASMDPKDRKQVLAKIVHTQAFIASDPAAGKMANVSIFVLRAPGDAAEILAKIEAMAAKNVETINAGKGMMKVKEFTTQEFKGVKADVAKKILLVMGRPEAKGGHATHIIRVARGTIMLEMMLVKMEMTDEQIIHVLEKVFTRIARARVPAKPSARPTTRKAA